MNIKVASAAHGLSAIIKDYKENRPRIKLDLTTMNEMGVILYTDDYMTYDSRCNETVRGANKEIIISATRCVQQIMKQYRELEVSFAVIRVDAIDNCSWPILTIVITNMRGNVLDFSLSFNDCLVVKHVAWNNKADMAWYKALRSDFGNY